jgi:hypothetical protein
MKAKSKTIPYTGPKLHSLQVTILEKLVTKELAHADELEAAHPYIKQLLTELLQTLRGSKPT